MGLETENRERNRAPIGRRPGGPNHGTMAAMDPIEIADGDHGAASGGRHGPEIPK